MLLYLYPTESENCTEHHWTWIKLWNLEEESSRKATTYDPNISIKCLQCNITRTMKCRTYWGQQNDNRFFSTDSLKEKNSDTFNLRRLYLAIHFLDGCSSLKLVFKAHKPKTTRSSSLLLTGTFHCKSTTAQIVLTYGLPLLWKLIGQV